VKNSVIITVIIAVIVGVGAFFGGMKYQESKTSNSSFSRQFQRGASTPGVRQAGPGNQGRFPGGRPVVGEILSLDDKSITVKLQDGSSKIVLLPETATISKTDEGSKADLKSGIRVGVFGTDNSDGSITAQNIQISPAFRSATTSGSAR